MSFRSVKDSRKLFDYSISVLYILKEKTDGAFTAVTWDPAFVTRYMTEGVPFVNNRYTN